MRGRIVDVDSGRFVLVLAGDAEAALQLNDRVHARLEEAAAAGHLEGMRSLHSFLWSQQRRSRRSSTSVAAASPSVAQCAMRSS